jgi:hypothetical protein
MSVFYNYPSGDLEYLIEEQIGNQREINSDTLISILYSCSKSLALLQKNRMIHGHVSPKYIGISENGFEIMDRLNDPSSPV